jgi:hypothetical protein
MRTALFFALFAMMSGCFSEPGVGRNDENECTSDEVCDGVDNDCDGEVDENFPALGESCSLGMGACASSGTIVCSDDGETACDAEPSAPGDELCGDVIDNDCDGEIDEGFDDLGLGCSAGLGMCERAGEQVCSSDQLTIECGAAAAEPLESPDETTCDGLDNDCDGEVDEGCDSDEDGWCAMGFVAADGGPCGQGSGDCDDEDPTVYPGAPGKCDGKDTNCDGDVDNVLAVEESAWEFDLDGDLAAGAGSSPILAAATPTGFCVAFTGGPDVYRVRSHVDTTGRIIQQQRQDRGLDERIQDLTWGGESCVAVYLVRDGTEPFDIGLERYDSALSDDVGIAAVNDDVYPFQDAWAASVEVVGGDIVIAFSDQDAGSARYVTAPVDFASAAEVVSGDDIAPIGAFGELVSSPTSRDLLHFANFAAVIAADFDVGSAGTQLDGLRIDSSVARHEMVARAVGATTYLAVHNTADDRFELRAVAATAEYGATGNTPPYAAASGQEYVNRELFAQGLTTAAMFADAAADVVYQMDDDGTDITFQPVPGSRGDLLALRNAGSDVVQAIWMLDPGTPGSAADETTLQVVDYTCH